jgi:hypothetical protein
MEEEKKAMKQSIKSSLVVPNEGYVTVEDVKRIGAWKSSSNSYVQYLEK